jgi:hypothetical protein
MQWEQLKKTIGFKVQLIPVACCLDKSGNELPATDDDWRITRVSNEGVDISNERTLHETILGPDHIHHFTSNPGRSRSEVKFGFLTLNVQVFLQETRLWVRPNGRPGEPVKPPAQEVINKWVDVAYPYMSGIQTRLESSGYRVGWCRDADLPRKVDLEGWEIVVEPDSNGRPTAFHLRDLPTDQTLVKKRVS